MPLSQALLPEFDHEMANTRRSLERVPDDRLDWRPHEKSWTMGGLATHVANIPHWTVLTLTQDSLDLAPPGAPPFKLEEARSRKELLERFDRNVAQARAAIAATSDADFSKPWTLFRGGESVMVMTRIAVFRGFVMNHLIHHRAQLGVYLRLNNIPVPAIYGPSADEGSL